MANTGCSAFSPDGQYFAYCGNDGKLKIWDTVTRFKREFIPNLHLQSPCSVIQWIYVSQESTGASPAAWKKQKKKLIEDSKSKGIVAMGSIDGKVTLYDTASASVNSILQNGHTAAITAATWSANCGFFTAGDDHQIVEWNIQEKGVKCRWKSGKTKVTALALAPDGKSLISAEKCIKWWDLATKQIIRTFPGHANQITSLNPITVNNSNYVISGCNNEGYLSVWALNEHKNDRTAVAHLTLQDDAISVTVHVSTESQVIILAITRSGQAHIFKYQPNGNCLKPLKPSLNLTIASDINSKEGVKQIHILSGKVTEDEKLLLAYGSYIHLNFEKVIPDFSDTVQYLVRSEIQSLKGKKEEAVLKIKAAVTEDSNVEYLAPGATIIPLKRTKESGTSSQLLLKDRLENLSLDADINSNRRTPTKGFNMAQLLIQGLNSKDKNILTNVLYTKHENVIRNTIAKLPVQAIIPLLKELTTMLQNKTYASQIAVKWIQALISTHAAYLISHPNLREILSPVLSFIDAKVMLLPEILKLCGRVSLATGQIAKLNEESGEDIMEECLLDYQDSDSSADSTDMGDNDVGSESDDNWDETLDQEDNIEQNEDAADEDSICS